MVLKGLGKALLCIFIFQISQDTELKVDTSFTQKWSLQGHMLVT